MNSSSFSRNNSIYEYIEIKLVLDNKFSCSLCRMDGEERGNTIDHGINALCIYNGISKNSRMRFLGFERDFFFFWRKWNLNIWLVDECIIRLIEKLFLFV